MGGFFLTNNLSESVQDVALEVFAYKDMTQYTAFQLGGWRVFYFPKRVVNHVSHIYRRGEDVIIGIGTFFYQGQCGEAALALIYDDYLQNPGIFNEVFGHFNFILFINDTLMLVTDKTGSYHSFMAEENGSVYMSSSTLAVARQLKQVTPGMQEVLEFIHFKATLGEKTIFQEIGHTPWGSILTLAKAVSCQPYFAHKVCSKPTTIESLTQHLEKQLSWLKDLDLTKVVEITAGFDSRLVLATLAHLDCSYTMATHAPSPHPMDVEIARIIAKGESYPWQVIYPEWTPVTSATIEKELYTSEAMVASSLGRSEQVDIESKSLGKRLGNALKAFHQPPHAKHITELGDLVLGGYGGELYRDAKTRKIRTFDELVKGQYGKALIESGDITYLENVKQKLMAHPEIVEGTQIFEHCEKAYYFGKMQYWGGNHISRSNQSFYRYHPLLDYLQIYPLFSVPPEEKSHGKFQMQMIENFSPRLAGYPSGYGYNFQWHDRKAKEINKIRKEARAPQKSQWDWLRNRGLSRFYTSRNALQKGAITQLVEKISPSKIYPSLASIQPNTEDQKWRLYAVELLFDLIGNGLSDIKNPASHQ